MNLKGSKQEPHVNQFHEMSTVSGNIQRICLAGIFSVISIMGCGSEHRAGVTYETIGDTLFVHNTLPDESQENLFRFERDLVIGVAEGEENYMLPSKGYLAAGQDGLIYYFNTMDRAVRVFGVEGRFIRGFGRAGQGPGEFNPQGGGTMYPQADGSVAIENWPSSLLIFDANGGFRRGIDFNRLSSGIRRSGRIESPYYWMPNRGILIVQWNIWAMNEDSIHHFMIIEDDSTSIRWLPGASVPPSSYWEAPGTGVSLPHSSRYTCTLTGDRVLVWGVSSEFRLTMYDLDADTWRIVTLNRIPEPVTNDDIEQFLGEMSESRRGRFRAMLKNAPVPEFKPVFDELIGDDSGRIWVRHDIEEPWLQHPEGYRYDLFDAEGHWLGEVVSPRLIEAVCGEHVYAFGWEEYPTIERYRLIPE